MIDINDIEIVVANASHVIYVDEVLETINHAAKVRGTGIAKRSPEYVKQKMIEGKAVLALYKGEKFAGFSYIESWSNKTFVANSGLIVAPEFRGIGLAKLIKRRIFDLSREMFPQAKIFSLTTGEAVMKMNSELGYRPVTFPSLTDDEAFWRGCESCVNFDILQRNGRRMCLCTGMLYDPAEHNQMKYPIGIQSFEQLREDGYVYVDKTALVHKLATTGKIYFLSRPRRFGKSLLVSTLKNYFLGRKELFKGLAIEQLETEWNTYPIFHIDFNGTNFTSGDMLEKKIESYVSGYEAEYGKSPQWENISLGDRFAYVLARAHERHGRRCVVLIDEYDKPILDVLDAGYKVNVDGQEWLIEDRNREILKGFYSVFKAADGDLQFVFLTGVTKFSQVSVFSGFNQPADISMDPRYEALCGITQEELESTFGESIREMAEANDCTEDEMKATLKLQYDGYHFSKRMCIARCP